MTYEALIEKARELGLAIQDTDEFTAFLVAKTAADNSEELQDKLGRFNLKKLYEEIVSDPLMIAYSTTKDELDVVVRFILQIIQGSADGENPYEIEEQSCGGDCSSCGGCH